MAYQSIASSSLPLFKQIDGFKTPEQIWIDTAVDPSSLFEPLPEQGLAIVGTRYPQRRSIELLESVMRSLRGTDLIILSGFARGVDSRAHELAIENGLRTIAILGCGIDFDYPRENRFLRRRIVDAGGMVLSHFPCGTSAYASNFLERNQLIAGFSKATWVVEAAEVSGTLNTANWAMRMNRNLYATSSFPQDPFFQGNEKLLSQRDPDRFAIAEPLFGAHSFATTWSCLGIERDRMRTRKPVHSPAAQTLLQKWVLQLKSEYGSCHLQTLANLAASKGMAIGAFYSELEKELESKTLLQFPSGEVDLGLSSVQLKFDIPKI